MRQVGQALDDAAAASVKAAVMFSSGFAEVSEAGAAEQAQLTARARAASGENEWLELRRRFLTLLDEQARLERMARIIGKDALPARQRLTLMCAELINEAFLRQSAFSAKDHYCGPERQACMMRMLVRFIELAESAAAAAISPEAIAALPVMRPLARMGEDIGEDELQRLAALEAQIVQAFESMTAGTAATAAATVGAAAPPEGGMQEDAHAA